MRRKGKEEERSRRERNKDKRRGKMTERKVGDGSKEGVREQIEGKSGRKVLVYSITVSQFLRIHFSRISNVPLI